MVNYTCQLNENEIVFFYLWQLINKSLLIDKRYFVFISARSIPDNQPSNSWLWSNQIKWPFYFLLEKNMVLQHFSLIAPKKIRGKLPCSSLLQAKNKKLKLKNWLRRAFQYQQLFMGEKLWRLAINLVCIQIQCIFSRRRVLQ